VAEFLRSDLIILKSSPPDSSSPTSSPPDSTPHPKKAQPPLGYGKKNISNLFGIAMLEI
jgi:hypothetical protein